MRVEGEDISPENLAARQEMLAKRAAEEKAYQEELAKQKAAGVPQWMDAYNAFKKNDPNFVKMQRDAGYYDIDRPWNADDGTKTLKLALDEDYKRMLAEYNAKHGTNYQPDARQIGVNAQPNDWDHKRNSNGGFLADTISHVGEVVSKNPLARMAVSAAGQMVGIPANMTYAALMANDVAQGRNIEDVAKGAALSYIGGQVGGWAKSGVGDFLKDSGVADGVANAASSIAGNAASSATGAALTGQNIGDSISKGIVNGAIGQVGKAAGDAARTETAEFGSGVSDAIATAANTGTQAVLKGKNAGEAIINGAIDKGLNEIKSVAISGWSNGRKVS